MAVRQRPLKFLLISGAAVLLTVAVVVGLVAVRHEHTAVISNSVTSCAASSLSVTGTKGERLHAAVLPTGFVLTLGSEDDLGAMNVLTFNQTPSSNGDYPYIEIQRRITTQPVGAMVEGSDQRPITVQGKPGVVAGGAPTVGWINVAWQEASNTVVIVTGHQISEGEVIDVANHVQYQSGTPFIYPARPKFSVTRDQALRAFGASAKTAVLTSLGEVDTVIHSARPINHPPTIAAGVDVIQPVWVVWGGTPGSAAKVSHAVVLDANSGAWISDLQAVDEASLASLTDRSSPGCEPPLGVLTRSEFAHLLPSIPGTTSNIKLMTLETLRSVRPEFGNCTLLICDPTVPVWVWTTTRNDQSAGSWVVRPFDARTGPQSSELEGAELGGGGPLPADVAALQGLATK